MRKPPLNSTTLGQNMACSSGAANLIATAPSRASTRAQDLGMIRPMWCFIPVFARLSSYSNRTTSTNHTPAAKNARVGKRVGSSGERSRNGPGEKSSEGSSSGAAGLGRYSATALARKDSSPCSKVETLISPRDAADTDPVSSNVPSSPGESESLSLPAKSAAGSSSLRRPFHLRPIFGIACAEEDTKEVRLDLDRNWQGGMAACPKFVPSGPYMQPSRCQAMGPHMRAGACSGPWPVDPARGDDRKIGLILQHKCAGP